MKWILCAVESPKQGENVLLTFKNETGLYVGQATYNKGAYYYTDMERFEESYSVPVAWMALPEPYNISEHLDVEAGIINQSKHTKKNCNDCNWINIAEEQQINVLGDQECLKHHECLKHKIRLFHRSSEAHCLHNYIYPCKQCAGKDFEQRGNESLSVLRSSKLSFMGKKHVKIPVILSKDERLDEYFNGTRHVEQVNGVTRGKQYLITEIQGFGNDAFDVIFTNDNGEQQRLGSFFFEDV